MSTPYEPRLPLQKPDQLDDISEAPNWNGILRGMFSDRRFHQSKTRRRRWQAEIDGTRVGVVVSWRPTDDAHHALNQEDLETLLKLKRNGSFQVAFVVLAMNGYGYVRQRDAEQLAEDLKEVQCRIGQFGAYWLLHDDFVPLDGAPLVSSW